MAFIQRKQVAPSSHKTISLEEAKLISYRSYSQLPFFIQFVAFMVFNKLIGLPYDAAAQAPIDV